MKKRALTPVTVREANPSQRLAAAEDSKTDPEVLAYLVDDPVSGIREALAYNPATPARVVAELVSDRDQYVRYAAARHPEMAQEKLEELAGSFSIGMRLSVARNQNCPPEVLGRLSEDDEWVVRQEVAKNAATPPEVLARLGKDRRSDVRAGVAQNPNTPAETLLKLAVDTSREVQYELAHNPEVGVEVLAMVVRSFPDGVVGRAVAEHEAVSTEILACLVEQGDPYVCEGILRNSAVALEVRRAAIYKVVTDKRYRLPRWSEEMPARLLDEWELARELCESDLGGQTLEEVVGALMAR